MSEGLHTYIATYIYMYNICTYISIHKYVYTYLHNIHSYILTQSAIPNKMAHPAMHENYAVTIVPDFITATLPMVNG